MNQRFTWMVAASCLALAGTAQADWAKDIKNMAIQKANDRAAQETNLATTAPPEAKVYFISPKNGDTVTSPVKVVFGLSNAGVAPAGTNVEGTGHHHVLINNPKVDLTLPLPTTDQVKHFGKGQTETMLTLPPGTHTLQLVFADWKHQPFNPPVASETITITVK